MSEHINLGELPDTETLRAAVEVERTVLFWGQPHVITPRLVDQVFGDGRRLYWLSPTLRRPNHYVVRVDSEWNEWDFGDHLDEVLEAIAEEYGGECDDFAQELPEAERGFPLLSVEDDGWFWGWQDWPSTVRLEVAA